MKTLSRMLFVTAVTLGLLGVAASAARADEWNDHEEHARDWHRHHHGHAYGHDHDRPVIVEEPNVVYAPPVIVEPPPPPEEDSSPGLNIVIPINIR